ncbi:hypothetical protein ACSMXN_18640 [Jatrophihabitans sp. DSM 45814]
MVLGPFVIGGGVVLATLSGSVAVAAATVITASTIGLPDLGPSHGSSHVVAVHTSTKGSNAPGAPTTGTSAKGQDQSASAAAQASFVASPPWSSSAAANLAYGQVSSAPAASLPTPHGPANTGTGRPAPSESAEGPAGNAIVFIDGYNGAHATVSFEYATIRPGAGRDGQDLYLVESKRTYSAGLAPDISIVSGSTICPPAGSLCTPAELVAASTTGFFAEVGIDAGGVLRSVIERDNHVGFGSQSPPNPSQGDTSQTPSETNSPAALPAPATSDTRVPSSSDG